MITDVVKTPLTNPFSGDKQFYDLSRYVTEHEYVQIPQQATTFTGINATGNPYFVRDFGPRDYVCPIESFVEFNWRIRDGNNGNPTSVTNIGPSKFSWDNAIRDVNTQLAHRDFESVSNVNRIAPALRLLTRSEQWLETSGSEFQAQDDFTNVRLPLTGLTTRDGTIISNFRPATGFWSHAGLRRIGRGFKLSLTPDPQWGSAIVESSGAHKTRLTAVGAAAANDYIIDIVSVTLYMSVYRTNDAFVLPREDLFTLASSEVYPVDLSTATSINQTINAGSYDTYAIALYMEGADRRDATDTTKSPSYQDTLSATDVSIDFAGKQYPRQRYTLDFANRNWGRAYKDFIEASSGASTSSGASCSYTVWGTQHPIYAWKTPVRPGVGASQITTRIIKAPTACTLNVIVFYDSHVVLDYKEDGEIGQIAVFDSERQYALNIATRLEAAVSQQSEPSPLVKAAAQQLLQSQMDQQ